MFFLISQPLIYLIEVPFSPLGFGIFKYYPGWFVWTLLTLPGAFIGWYIKKKNYLSILVYMVAVVFLSCEFTYHLHSFLGNPPYQIVALIFIVGQIALYVLSFSDKKKRCIFASLSLVSLILITFLLRNQ